MRNGAGEWDQVHSLLFEMRAEGIISVETMRPYHRSLWKQAKRELGFFKDEATPPRKLRARRAYAEALKKGSRRKRK